MGVRLGGVGEDLAGVVERINRCMNPDVRGENVWPQGILIQCNLRGFASGVHECFCCFCNVQDNTMFLQPFLEFFYVSVGLFVPTMQANTRKIT